MRVQSVRPHAIETRKYLVPTAFWMALVQMYLVQMGAFGEGQLSRQRC
jgi:hypothetical protein